MQWAQPDSRRLEYLIKQFKTMIKECKQSQQNYGTPFISNTY